MSDPNTPEASTSNDMTESFGSILSQFEREHTVKPAEGSREGTVISISSDAVFLDIGFKTEGILPISELGKYQGKVNPGDKLQVAIKSREPGGYYQLTLGKAVRPADWAALEKAFAEKATIVGTVMEVVKGGLSVDVGVRAFMPASRSGARDAAEMEKLVEQEIRCRITKLDATDEDIVVDHRVVAEEEQQAALQQRYSEMKEGLTLTGIVRSLMDYGAFVDIGGVDALLHVGDISWARINKPSDVLAPGQEIEVRVLKIDPEKRRISVGLKQLQPHPWDSVPAKYKVGDRVRGTITRLTDFGAFMELEPGVEGLIHVSEMSWAKKVRKPGDLLNAGDTAEAIILGVNPEERRISLGLKQAMGDPWRDATRKFPVGSAVEGKIVSLAKFGAFIQLTEGVEGMIHISDISAERRLNHPQDMLKLGQTVRAQVLEIDPEARRLKLGMKQLLPTSIDEYLAEQRAGNVVSGRVVEISNNMASVELGEGIHATCKVQTQKAPQERAAASQVIGEKADLNSLSSMLQARWKSGAVAESSKPQELQPGQVRSFRIARLDPSTKKIELELTSN